MTPIRWILSAVAAGFLGAAPVGAEETGTLSFTRTYVQDYATIDFAGGSVTGGSLDGVVTILESSGGPFVEDARHRVTCIVLAKRSQDDIDLEASCTATNASGEQWYTLSKRSSGNLETGGPGTLEILGGTGAFEGVTGACTYGVSYLEGGWVSLTTDCTWQK